MEKTIKNPRRITEDEFFEYLEDLKPHQISKDFIMSFYQRLKAFDDKNGNHLTYQSFGVYPSAQYRIYRLCDQATILFLTEECQKRLEKEWSAYTQKAQELLNLGATNDELINTAKRYIDKQEEILKNSLDPIGFADLFRFQFVNFVDEVVMGDNGGQYDVKTHKLTICKKKVMEVPSDSEKFWDQNIIAWHELVHLMELKSYNNGKVKYLTPFYMEGEDSFFLISSDVIRGKVQDDGQDKVNELAIKCFKEGDWILNEILTELFTFRLWQTPEPLVLKENTYRYENAPILSYVFFDKEKQFEWNTNYLKFSSLIEIANAFYEHRSHILSNPTRPPTWCVIENLRDMFVSSKPSKKVLDAVNKNLAEIGVEEPSEKSMFQKFVLILGRAVLEYKNPNATDKIPFNPHFQLAQTLLLDMYLNDFKEKAKQNPNASMQNESFVKNLLNRHFVLHYWLMLPNKNVGTEENPVWAKRELSPSELFAMQPDNLLLEVWAGATEKMYEAVRKVCPNVIHDKCLMERTDKYLKKTKQINPEK